MIGELMGRKRKNVINPNKICSARYCNNRTNVYGTDSYCDECRKYANKKRELKKKGRWGNYLYVYFDHNENALYVGITGDYIDRHEEHLRGDKVFIQENLWKKRIVYKIEDINRVELEYLEYVLIQYHKTKSELLTNHQKMQKASYDHIPLERQRELKVLLCNQMKTDGFFENLNDNYNKVKMQNIDINYLKNCKKKSSCLATEDLKNVV